MDDFFGEFQSAGNHCAARFAAIKKVVLIHFFSDGVMADKNDIYFFIITRLEQIKQHEKTFADILFLLIHRTGNIHDAKHHGLCGGFGLFDAIVIT